MFWFAFGRLDHHRPSHWPGNRRRVKSVIHQTFCDIFDFDSHILPLPKIENALMRNEAMFAFEENREIRVESLCDVVGTQDCDFCRFR